MNADWLFTQPIASHTDQKFAITNLMIKATVTRVMLRDW
jgi:hypothetical protein